MKEISILVILAGFALFPGVVRADEAALPGGGFAASHYEALWTKSPFAVATSEAAPESADYTLVGIAQFDGVAYASLVEKQNQEHFLLSGDKPVRGLTLVSIARGHDGTDTTAVVLRNGEQLTLKLTSGAGPAASGLNATPFPVPQIPMPGQAPPPVYFHHRLIHIPPAPGQAPSNESDFQRDEMYRRYPVPPSLPVPATPGR
jgi:hypothetical protein